MLQAIPDEIPLAFSYSSLAFSFLLSSHIARSTHALHPMTGYQLEQPSLLPELGYAGSLVMKLGTTSKIEQKGRQDKHYS